MALLSSADETLLHHVGLQNEPWHARDWSFVVGILGVNRSRESLESLESQDPGGWAPQKSSQTTYIGRPGAQPQLLG